VRREIGDVTRRGVVFLKQIVPGASMALVALAPPISTFVAVGSAVTLHAGRTI